jgi:hypothetical protein
MPLLLPRFPPQKYLQICRPLGWMTVLPAMLLLMVEDPSSVEVVTFLWAPRTRTRRWVEECLFKTFVSDEEAGNPSITLPRLSLAII